MVTIYKNYNMTELTSGENQLEFRGLSTDEKPTTIGFKTIDNGAVFIEMDTGKLFFFDADNSQWKEV